MACMPREKEEERRRGWKKERKRKALETKRREKKGEGEEPLFIGGHFAARAREGEEAAKKAVNVIYAYENCTRVGRNIKMSIKTSSLPSASLSLRFSLPPPPP